MTEKEIIELIAGLNPAGLEAVHAWLTYRYVELATNAFVLISAFAIIMGGLYKLITKVHKDLF